MSEQKRNDTLYTCDNCGETCGTTDLLHPKGWHYFSVYSARAIPSRHACSDSCLISLLLMIAADVGLPAPIPSAAADLVDEARVRLGLDAHGQPLTAEAAAAARYLESERHEALRRRSS